MQELPEWEIQKRVFGYLWCVVVCLNGVLCSEQGLGSVLNERGGKPRSELF